LLALVLGLGIYEADLARAAQEMRHRTGPSQSEKSSSPKERRDILSGLIAGIRVEQLAGPQRIAARTVDREFQLLQCQLQPQNWLVALRGSALPPRRLRAFLLTSLQGEQWMESEVAKASNVASDEALPHFQESPAAYTLPGRWRARHIFLAAPPETPADVIATKEAFLQAAAARIAQGEKFEDFVASTSEDEATRYREGDLNFFSEKRMPPDFLAAVRGMKPGQVSGVVRTYLGFHIVRLTEMQRARPLTFAEAEAEIDLDLANRKRLAAVGELTAKLAKEAEFIRFEP
jgi:parvulin-like peptidyl-prolyl isomerase